MARTPFFDRVRSTLRKAHSNEADEDRSAMSRRDVLRLGGLAAATLAIPRVLTACGSPDGESSERLGTTRSPLVSANIGIVGAGIAGLACATQLKGAGIVATIHEAGERTGGRIYSSMNDATWGQAFEKGGEFIDTGHKTMIAYARDLGLQMEEVIKPVRDTFYYFKGERVPESVMVEEYRVLVDSMRDDLRVIGSPTADTFTATDASFDRITLTEYLASRNAAPRIKSLLEEAYTIEYGLDADRIGCLSFLLFAKASRQAKLRLFGNFSDERYHVVGGNQQITNGLAARLSGQIKLGRKLLAVKKLSDGRVQLTFQEGRSTTTAVHDAVVLTLPFHLLREVAFDASVALPSWKEDAIRLAVCGNNAKLMVGFNGRPWVEAGGNGTAYSDLPYLQSCWESSPGSATATRAILTDYTGGALATSQSQSSVQADADRFLTNYNTILPGAKARARRDSRGNYVCHLELWPSNPLTKGAYTANAPGYFTTIAGNEGKPVGNLHFGGETTDSFYSWQGFMEGGALSGLRTAAEILATLK